MTPPNDTHAPTAPQPRLDDPPPPSPVNIDLGTSVNGNTITITGDRSPKTLNENQPATHFNFTLNDTSGANVQFGRFDAEDDSSVCPPGVTGNQSNQITGVTTNNVPANNKSARFTDNNNNPSANGALDITYQWNFTCDAPYSVLPFDPMITNIGKTGPL